MQETNEDSALKKAADVASNMAKNKIKKSVAKKVIAATVATGGGCLIPIVLLLIILLVTGMLSAMTLNRKFDYDEIKEEAREEGISAKEYLFNEIYSATTGELHFTEKELKTMAFDKKSLKTMFELIAAYNSEQLTENIAVEYKGRFSVPASYSYWADKNGDGDYSPISKATYNSYLLKDPGFDFYKTVKEYKTKYEYIEKDICLNNTWIREKYPVDWQIVYMLCFYDSFDNGDSSTDYDVNGKKVRLKRSYIKEVIEDVSGEIRVKEDVSADCLWATRGTGTKKHALDAVNYDWGLGKVTQEEITDGYGAYKSITPFYAYVKYRNKRYRAYFTGNVPVSRLIAVQTLTSYDKYGISATGDVSASDLINSTYDITKLEMLIEKYGHGRDVEAFVSALKELPGGEDIAAEIELAIYEIEERDE